MVNRDTRRALAHAGGRPDRPGRIVVRRSVMPDEATGPVESGEQPADTTATQARVVEPVPARRSRPPAMSTSNGRAGRARPDPAAVDGRRRLTYRVSLVVLLVALAAVIVAGRQWYEQGRVESARQEALAAARQTAVDFVTISAATVDRDLQRVAAGATGDFKEEFTRAMAQVRAAVIENKVDSRGTVLRAAVVSADRASAVALVAVDATVHNVNAPDGRLAHYRIRVTLALVDAAWLVSRLEFVG